MSLFNRGGGRGGGVNNPTNRPVCKFYLEGRCRYGDACHNYHPPRDQQNSSQGRNQALPYNLNPDHLKADFTYGDERPTWPLSAYAPGKDAPRQLLEGALEQSPEELRVLYYLAKAAGSTQEYEQNEQSAVAEANQRAQQILSDLDGAIKYVIEGKDIHPNREDMVQKPSGSFNWLQRPSFNQSANSASSGTSFGQSSSFGSTSGSTFGKPAATSVSGSAFGQPSTGSTPFGGQGGSTTGFGKPSALGGASTGFGQPSALGGGSTAFGKPSALGGASTFGAQTTSNSTPFGQAASNSGSSTFGQPASNTGSSTFGQPASNKGGSTFGQPSASSGGTAFGQPSAPGSNSTFGKPSPFGAAASSTTPAFGQSGFGTKPAASSPFGQASQPAQQQSAFGQPSQASQKTSAFGQPSQPGQQTSAFGQPSQPGQQQSTFGKPSPFGSSGSSAPAAAGQSTFGTPSAFGAAANKSPFGQQSQAAQQRSPFGGGGQSTSFNGSNVNTSLKPFGSEPTPSSPSTLANTATRTPGQRLTNFKGRPVTYEGSLPFYNNPNTGKKERIWMPDGAPGPNPDVETAPGTYEALGAVIKQVYDYMRENGTFKDGIVPEVPPKREWVDWNL
ncbi:hypothetical protein LTR37_011640 [Vermiconidia calcicola]|uniref:Uncharacterized protein n=1 Tax=Vermiconidia calcicola TaxID=1690605 RepID=A0ACC3N1X7_9PEZI|nr:hypothetical protein LTR37_011640 [Vermiconidia calcicola]